MTSQQRVHSWADGKDLGEFGLRAQVSRQQAEDTGARGQWFYPGVCSWLRRLHVMRFPVLGNCNGHRVAQVLSLLCLLLPGPPFPPLARPPGLPNF